MAASAVTALSVLIAFAFAHCSMVRWLTAGALVGTGDDEGGGSVVSRVEILLVEVGDGRELAN